MLLRGLEMQGRTHYASAEPSRTIVITYMPEDVSFPFPLGKCFLFVFDKLLITQFQSRIECPKM